MITSHCFLDIKSSKYTEAVQQALWYVTIKQTEVIESEFFMAIIKGWENSKHKMKD